MNNEIIQYITQQLQNGFTLKKIKEILLEHYPTNDINESIEFVVAQHVNNILPELKQLLLEGKSLDEIKSYSLSQEHDELIVNELIKQLNIEQKLLETNSLNSNDVVENNINNNSSNPNKIPLNVLFVAMIFFVSLIIGVYFFYTTMGETHLLDVTTEKLASSSIVYPGQEYEFKVEAINLGKKENYDITFTYFLEDLSGNLIIVKSNTKAISTSLSYIQSLEIPNNVKKGNYKITVEADYGTGIARSSFTLKIMERNSDTSINNDYSNKEISSQSNTDLGDSGDDGDSISVEDKVTYNPVTKDTYKESNNDNLNDDSINTKTSSYSNEKITSDEIVNYYTQMTLPVFSLKAVPLDESSTFDKISSIAKTNPEEAKTLCSRMPLDGSQQSCYALVKDITEPNIICKNQTSYLGFIICLDDLKTDVNVNELDCNNIINLEDRTACEEFLETHSDTNVLDVENIPTYDLIGEGYQPPPDDDDDYFGTEDIP